MNPKLILISFLLFFTLVSMSAQPSIDSLLKRIQPGRFTTAVKKKLDRVEKQIISQSLSALCSLQKLEEKMCEQKLLTADSLAAKKEFENLRARYRSLENSLKNEDSILPNSTKYYLAHLDSVETAIKFIQHNSSIRTGEVAGKIVSLKSALLKADEVKRFLQERKQQLKQQFLQADLVRELKKFSKAIYYYSESLKEWKLILSDPKKIEKKAIELLAGTGFFRDFMKRNSVLASLFRLPGDVNDPAYLANISGLQARTQVSNIIQQQLSTGGTNELAQFGNNVNQAQQQLQQLKNKFNNYVYGNSREILAEGFKPNSQRTKSFFKRLEYGINTQSQKSSNLFPVTSDLALSVAYKLNDRSLVGIAASYKLGWGQNLRRIQLSSQGYGLRSFIDWQLKASFWITGGVEINYRSPHSNFLSLSNTGILQQSALLGLSKIVAIRSKFFDKAKLQLLWDFLSYQQMPRTKPLLFRVCYHF
jgi:hypothetical protein